MITLEDIYIAEQNVRPYIRHTPLFRHDGLSKLLNTNIYLKMELFQHTGSFKPRGAFHQIVRLSDDQRANGVVAASGGNFAVAVAYAGSLLGVQATICMPEFTPANYVEAAQSYGASIEFYPDLATSFAQAQEYDRQGRPFLHPFDNQHQMSGCGTLALELLEDVPQITDVLVSIGGGGLLAGVTVALKAIKPDVRIWGVETELSPTLNAALEAGEPVQITPRSLARTLGAPRTTADILALMQQHLTDLVMVSDEEAIDQQRYLLDHAKVLTELAASCTLAAAHRIKDRFSPDDQAVLVLCGGNDTLANMQSYP